MGADRVARDPLDYFIAPVGRAEAAAFIKRYEWLGTAGPRHLLGSDRRR